MIDTSIYITLTILAFIFLFLAYAWDKKGQIITTQMLAFILFSFLAISATEITSTYCQTFTNKPTDIQSPQLAATNTGFYIILNSGAAIQKDNQYELSLHIFRETGEPINSTGTICNVHLYDTKGEHIVNKNMVFAPSYDYELDIGAKNFTETGRYFYRIACSGGTTPTRYGFLNSYVDVVEDVNNPMYCYDKKDYNQGLIYLNYGMIFLSFALVMISAFKSFDYIPGN